MPFKPKNFRFRPMKRIHPIAFFVFFVFVAFPAMANQGLFGGRPSQDGASEVRVSTTEQFDPIRGQSVSARPRADFDPTPIDVESFQFFPSLTTAAYYDSNIYATSKTAHDDAVTKVDPALSVSSNWGRHAVAFSGFADINNYVNNDTESFTSGAAQLDGRYDIAPLTWLSLAAGYQRDTEPRSSPSIPGGAAEPTQFDLYTGGVELFRGVGKLKLKANYDFNYFDYDPVTLVGGGIASQNGRNRYGNAVRGNVEYEISENIKPYIETVFDWRDYTSNNFRSSTGYNVDVGGKFDFGGVTTAKAYVGYIGRDYSHFSSGGVNAFDFGGNLLWNVTDLTSIVFEGKRTIEETTLGGIAVPTAASSYIASGGSVTVTHELRRNVLVEGNVGYTNNDFQRASRNDDDYDMGIGTRILISRNLYSDVTYDYSFRDSNTAGSDYSRHIALVRLGAQY